MDMLCIAAQHDPIGYICVNGEALNLTDLARMTGIDPTELPILIADLDRNGVFSRDSKGRIYSRRMVRDAKIARERQKNGKKGGLLSASRKKASSVCLGYDYKPHSDTISQKPEARVQKERKKQQQQQKPPPASEPSLPTDPPRAASPPRAAAAAEQISQALGIDFFSDPKRLGWIKQANDLVKQFDLAGEILPVCRQLRARGKSLQSLNYLVPILAANRSGPGSTPPPQAWGIEDWIAHLRAEAQMRRDGTWQGWPAHWPPRETVPREALEVVT